MCILDDEEIEKKMSFLLLWAATTIHREKFDAIKRSIVAGTSTPPSSLLLFCCCSWGCPQGPLLLPGLSIGSDLMTFTELLYSTSTSVIPPPPSSKEDDDENEHKVPHLYNVNWELFFVNASCGFSWRNSFSSSFKLCWSKMDDTALNCCVPKKDI